MLAADAWASGMHACVRGVDSAGASAGGLRGPLSFVDCEHVCMYVVCVWVLTVGRLASYSRILWRVQGVGAFAAPLISDFCGAQVRNLAFFVFSTEKVK